VCMYAYMAVGLVYEVKYILFRNGCLSEVISRARRQYGD
jgi:hypothetical protein